MKKEKIYCDRCGKEVNYPFNITHRIIKSKYTLMDIHDNYIDLCEDCSKSLTKWFKAKNISNEQNDNFPCFRNNEGDLIKDIRKAYHGKMSNNQNEEINIDRMVNKINKVLSNGDYKEIFVDYPNFPYHSKLSLYNAEKMIDTYYKDKSCKINGDN